MNDLSGKTVLLTGASGGIGAVTAPVLLEQGAHLIAHYGRDRDGAERACAGAPPERWTALQADLSQRGGARRLWSDALAWRERIDVVVLNAAVLLETPLDGDDDVWDDAWERTLRVNVIEPASLARAAVGHFRQHGGGTLITLSSWAAQRGSAIPQLGGYAASKAALHAFTQTIARNHAREGVLAYVVAPGIVRTPMSEISATHRGGIEAVNAILAMGEMVDPAEVGRLIAFLATGSVRHLTGATLDVNGATYIR
ncbi:MAG TPA: SDR family oxidoreductase [Solirubrobacter sp.]|nr:SDR family oxidoreductase [Solirubrobacter sp.]